MTENDGTRQVGWMHLPDDFLERPGMVDRSPEEIVLWLAALSYCSRHNTGGAFSEKALRRYIAPGAGVDAYLAGNLVSAGLWDFEAHDRYRVKSVQNERSGTSKTSGQENGTVTDLRSEVEFSRQSNPSSRVERDWRRLFDGLDSDELDVLGRLIERVRNQGVPAYGHLDIERDRRDFNAETRDEVLDALWYAGCEIERRARE